MFAFESFFIQNLIQCDSKTKFKKEGFKVLRYSARDCTQTNSTVVDTEH